MSRSFLLYAVLIVFFVSCKKENSSKKIASASRKPPVANAGADTTIVLPANTIKLDGTASYDPDGRITNYEWRRIGLEPVPINNSQQAVATATGLQPGIYSFEITVLDDTGLWTRDTMVARVEVIEPDQTSHVFTQLQWSESCIIKVGNINSYLPPNANFKVYLRSTFLNLTSIWTLINNNPGVLYYEIVNGEIRVRETNIDCNFDPSTFDILIDWD